MHSHTATLSTTPVLRKQLVARPAVNRNCIRVTAIFSKGKKAQPEPPRKKQGFLSQLTEALDFAEVRSEADRDLLDKAKSSMGKKGKAAGSGGGKQKLSKEQYQALRRRVGGTSKSFFKEFVQADEVKGYQSSEQTSVPGVPFLILVVLSLLGATGYVVTQTAGGPADTKTPIEQQQQSMESAFKSAS